MKKGSPLIPVVLAIVGGYVLLKKKGGAAPQGQLASISQYMTTAVVYRNSQWVLYNPLDPILVGETVSILVTQNCTLNYLGETYPLVTGWNQIVWR